MQKTPPSESGFSRVRLLAALVLCTVGAGLAVVGFAANPSSGTVTPTTTTPVTWQGTAPGGAGTCTEGLTCDSFKLTVSEPLRIGQLRARSSASKFSGS
jgi:hypothetical protein